MIKTPLSTMIGGAFWTPCATILGSSSQNLTQLIKSLFANQEQGFAYDPNDLTTLYQDAAGTVPVTTAGQPVGLILDKSKGLALGSELNTGAWTAGAGWTIADGIAKLALGGYGPLYHLGATTGKFYKITVKITHRAGLLQLYTNSNLIKQINAGGVQTVTYIGWSSAAGNGRLVDFYAQSGFDGEIDLNTVTIKEIAGNHAYQSVSASRPILQRNATTGAYYLAFDGADDFLQTNSIDFTATDKVSLFAGVRKLSDFSTGKIVELSNSVGNIGTFALNAPDSNGASNFSFATNGTALSDVKVSGFASPTSTVLTAFGNNTASTVQLKNRLRVNGVYPTAAYGGSIGAGNYGNYPLYIGRRGGTSISFNGHIYSLIGIARLTTNAETLALEKAIAKLTGVTLNV